MLNFLPKLVVREAVQDSLIRMQRLCDSFSSDEQVIRVQVFFLLKYPRIVNYFVTLQSRDTVTHGCEVKRCTIFNIQQLKICGEYISILPGAPPEGFARGGSKQTMNVFRFATKVGFSTYV